MNEFVEQLPEEWKQKYFQPNPEKWAKIDKWGDAIHNWYTIPAVLVLNAEGIKFFKDVTYVNVFRCKAGEIGPIHEDRQTSAAINWIVQGEGVHQWFHPESCKVLRYNRADNAIYDPDGAEIIYETDMKFMKAYTHIPHRVICTSDVDRVCISVRTTEKRTFNNL